MATAASQQFSEPTSASKAFSLYLNGDNYDYVMAYARSHNVTRNRAINLIIEDNQRTVARRGKRHPATTNSNGQ